MGANDWVCGVPGERRGEDRYVGEDIARRAGEPKGVDIAESAIAQLRLPDARWIDAIRRAQRGDVCVVSHRAGTGNRYLYRHRPVPAPVPVPHSLSPRGGAHLTGVG